MTIAGTPPRWAAVIFRRYCRIGDVREALVVNDDVEALRPVRVVVEPDVSPRPPAALNRDGPVDGERLSDRIHQHFGFARIVVAAAAAHDERLHTGLTGERIAASTPSSRRGLRRLNRLTGRRLGRLAVGHLRERHDHERSGGEHDNLAHRVLINQFHYQFPVSSCQLPVARRTTGNWLPETGN